MDPSVTSKIGATAGFNKERFVLWLFEVLSTRYDRLNALISLGQHNRWREKCLAGLGVSEGHFVADFCTGSGDFACLAARRVGSRGKVWAIDFSPKMIEIARAKAQRLGCDSRITFQLENVQATSIASGSMDFVTMGFALRNVRDPRKTLREMLRILKVGGRVGILELSNPPHPLVRWVYYLYLCVFVIPIGSLLLGNRWPLHYLSESIKTFFQPDQLAQYLEEVGFQNVRYHPILWGALTICIGDKLPSDHRGGRAKDYRDWSSLAHNIRGPNSQGPQASSDRQGKKGS